MSEEKKENYRFKDLKSFKIALETEPPEGWVQKRDIGGKSHLYIPISITESNADLFFREWYVIEQKPLNISNGVGFTVKIQALPDYPGADYWFFTGSGAVQFKTKAANHLEFDFPNACQKAIANAFRELGNVFGRNLNRKVNGVALGSGFTLRKPEKTEETPITEQES